LAIRIFESTVGQSARRLASHGIHASHPCQADCVDVEAIRAALAGTSFSDVTWVSETGSTNADLLGEARAGAAGGRVAVTDHQTAGRGRRGRTWSDPPGSSLLVSILFRPGEVLGPERAHLLTAAVALAAAEAVEEVAGVELDLKWPNDLVTRLAGDEVRKVAGVLAESILAGDRLEAVVVGTGLNVNWPDAGTTDLPPGGAAVNQLAGHPVDRGGLLVAWLRRLDHWWGAITDGRSDELLAAYRSRLSTLGQAVAIETPDGTLEGQAVDITTEGHLVLATPTGLRTFAVGDVVHLRPG
jgi:BirA family biotin operon repressor/biotin-[acetyl-CoA-carboxylase] ligase